jgi:acyl-CoA-dependent ceramide synthase
MVCSWLYTRVYYYGKIIWSTYTEPELYVPKFALDPLNGNWFPHFVKYIILGLMLGLYILIVFWTLMIFKVVFKLVTKTGITDVRSDDEDSNDSNEGIVNEKTKVTTKRKRYVHIFPLAM